MEYIFPLLTTFPQGPDKPSHHLQAEGAQEPSKNGWECGSDTCYPFNNTCLVLVLVLVTVVLAVFLPINSIQPPAPAPPAQRGRRGNKQAHSRGRRGLLENARSTHICILQEQRS